MCRDCILQPYIPQSQRIRLPIYSFTLMLKYRNEVSPVMLLRATFLRVMPVWLRVTCAGRYLVAVVLVLLICATAVEAQVEVTRLGPPGRTISDFAISGQGEQVVYAVGTQADRFVYRLDGLPDGSLPENSDAERISWLGQIAAHIRVHPGLSEIVFSGSLRSTDAGASWEEMAGVTHALAFNPLLPDVLWARGTVGLLRSRDAGMSWSLLSGIDLLDLSVSPADTSTVFGRTESGLVRSTDGGTSWAALDLAQVPISIATPPDDAAVVYVGTAEGLYRSADAGLTWGLVLEVGPVTHIEIDPSDAHRIFGVAAAGIHRSDDGGTSWTESQVGIDAPVTVVRIDPKAPERVLAGAEDASAFQSTDGGQTWTTLLISSVMFSGTPFTLDPNVPDRVIVNTQRGPGSLVSGDAGNTWMMYDYGTSSAPLRVYDLEFAASDPTRAWAVLWADSQNRVLSSYDGGLTWKQVFSTTVPGSTFIATGIHPADPNLILLHRLWREVYLSEDGGEAWLPLGPVRPGDLLDMAFAKDDPNTFFISTRATTWGERRLVATRDKGATWTEMDDGGDVVGRLHMSDGQEPLLYVARARAPGGLFRSSIDEISWEEVPIIPGGEGPEFAVFDVIGSASDASTLYVATSAGVFMSSIDGNSWDLVTSAQLHQLGADPYREDVLWGVHHQIGLHRISGLPVASESGPSNRVPLTISAPYPNPSRGEVNVTLAAPVGSEVTVTVYDLLGRPVRSLTVSAVGGGEQVELQWDGRDEAGSVVPAGVYVITLSATDERVSRTVLRL
jgi:photosystem II stability/assembly factor-like uncharacterized protein